MNDENINLIRKAFKDNREIIEETPEEIIRPTQKRMTAPSPWDDTVICHICHFCHFCHRTRVRTAEKQIIPDAAKPV